MIERRPFNELAGADHGWLKAKHHFSFGNYVDPRERAGAHCGSGTTTRSPPARAFRPTRTATWR